MRHLWRMAVGALVVLVLVGAGGAWYLRDSGHNKSTFRTVALKRGDIRATISATGTVEPEEVVDIGAQVAGQIVSFGKDEKGKDIDYGSAVKAGAVLAKIDDSLYRAQVAEASASLAQAKANQARAEADLLQKQATLNQAQNDWNRAQKLGPSEALASTQYDAYKANYEVAKANVAIDVAAIEQAKAAVTQAQAALDFANRNLAYCTITSPVDGVIIDRRVNIGQTVVSSLNAPSLFLLAKDLRHVQVWVSVNEADIGSIAVDMPATFTVDAFPGRVFTGQVGQIRLNATMTQNVVTYTVEVNTDNSDGTLLPYLTANVQFVTGSRQDVLLAPNGALRWTPRPEQIAAGSQAPAGKGAGRTNGSGASAASRPTRGADPTGQMHHGTLWVAYNGLVRPISVQTGLTDGTQTEVQGTGLSDGLQVVVGEQIADSGSPPSSGGSPFTPQFGRARRPANDDSGSGAGGPGGAGAPRGGPAGR